MTLLIKNMYVFSSEHYIYFYVLVMKDFNLFNTYILPITPKLNNAISYLTGSVALNFLSC